MATMIGALAALAWRIASMVCGITPSSAATTSTTMSVTEAPRARMAVNASWPGVSMKVIRRAGRHLDLIGADMLGDAARLAGRDIGRAQRVEQRRLAVIDVAHDGHHRRPRLTSSASVSACALQAHLDVGFGDAAGAMAELLHHQFGGIGIQRLGDGRHHAEFHQRLDHVGGARGHAVGQFLHRDLCRAESRRARRSPDPSAAVPVRPGGVRVRAGGEPRRASGRVRPRPRSRPARRCGRRGGRVGALLGDRDLRLARRPRTPPGRRTGRASSSSSAAARAGPQPQGLGRRGRRRRRRGRRPAGAAAGFGAVAPPASASLGGAAPSRASAAWRAAASSASAPARASSAACGGLSSFGGLASPRPRAGALPRRRTGSRSSPARAARRRAWRLRAAARPARAAGPPVRSRSARGRRRARGRAAGGAAPRAVSATLPGVADWRGAAGRCAGRAGAARASCAPRPARPSTGRG